MYKTSPFYIQTFSLEKDAARCSEKLRMQETVASTAIVFLKTNAYWDGFEQYWIRIRIKKKRVKTGILSCIPLLPMAKLLLEKYKGVKEGVVFPIQDPTDINEYLKDIATVVNISAFGTLYIRYRRVEQ